MHELQPDPAVLQKLLKTRMPFGKHKDMLLINLPESYVIWFKQKGFPEGELGELLAITCEIKINGLEEMLRPLMDEWK